MLRSFKFLKKLKHVQLQSNEIRSHFYSIQKDKQNWRRNKNFIKIKIASMRIMILKKLLHTPSKKPYTNATVKKFFNTVFLDWVLPDFHNPIMTKKTAGKILFAEYITTFIHNQRGIQRDGCKTWMIKMTFLSFIKA